MPRLLTRIVAFLLVPCLIGDPITVMASMNPVGAGFHPRPQSGIAPISNDISGRHGGLPLQLFTSQALALQDTQINPANSIIMEHEAQAARQAGVAPAGPFPVSEKEAGPSPQGSDAAQAPPAGLIPFVRPENVHDFLMTHLHPGALLVSVGPGFPRHLNPYLPLKHDIEWEAVRAGIHVQIYESEPDSDVYEHFWRRAGEEWAGPGRGRLIVVPRIQARFEKNHLEPHSVDAIVMFSVVTSPQISMWMKWRLLKAAGKALKPGGLLILGWNLSDGRKEEDRQAWAVRLLEALTRGRLRVLAHGNDREYEGSPMLGDHAWTCYHILQPAEPTGQGELTRPITEWTLDYWALFGNKLQRWLAQEKNRPFGRIVIEELGLRTVDGPVTAETDPTTVRWRNRMIALLSGRVPTAAYWNLAELALWLVSHFHGTPTILYIVWLQLGMVIMISQIWFVVVDHDNQKKPGIQIVWRLFGVLLLNGAAYLAGLPAFEASEPYLLQGAVMGAVFLRLVGLINSVIFSVFARLQWNSIMSEDFRLSRGGKPPRSRVKAPSAALPVPPAESLDRQWFGWHPGLESLHFRGTVPDERIYGNLLIAGQSASLMIKFEGDTFFGPTLALPEDEQRQVYGYLILDSFYAWAVRKQFKRVRMEVTWPNSRKYMITYFKSRRRNPAIDSIRILAGASPIGKDVLEVDLDNFMAPSMPAERASLPMRSVPPQAGETGSGAAPAADPRRAA